MVRLSSLLALGLMLTGCDAPHDYAYYNAHRDEAAAKLATCSDDDIKSNRACQAASAVSSTMRMETENAMRAHVCGLLTDAEASAFIGTAVHGSGSADAKRQTSECDWDGEYGHFVRITIQGPVNFAPDTTAQMFEKTFKGLGEAGTALEAFPDIGDRAVLVVKGGGLAVPDAAPDTIDMNVLKGETWVHISTEGLTREQTIAASRLAMKRR